MVMTNGKLSIDDFRQLLNKKSGTEVAKLASEANSEVTEWIPTGSTWLDSIICQGKLGGIPVGRISEIAGLESTGKSYMAAQIAANAQKQGIKVFYFDSEKALTPAFLANSGINIEEMLVLKPESVEFVLETIESILAMDDSKKLFIWDSLAFTPSNRDLEGDYNPQSSMAVKPRILSLGMSKLVSQFESHQATLLILNQLKTNITSSVAEAMTTPYFTPGGKALNYSYSLRIWLTGRKAKASFVEDDKGFRVGSEVKAKIEKSRFGTQGRVCTFKIIWGDDTRIGVQDEESILEALKEKGLAIRSGAWYTIKYSDGSEDRFQAAKWIEELKNSEEKKEKVMKLFYEETIEKFEKKEGDAAAHYSLSEEQ
jgi:recombination protein RecA